MLHPHNLCTTRRDYEKIKKCIKIPYVNSLGSTLKFILFNRKFLQVTHTVFYIFQPSVYLYVYFHPTNYVIFNKLKRHGE